MPFVRWFRCYLAHLGQNPKVGRPHSVDHRGLLDGQQEESGDRVVAKILYSNVEPKFGFQDNTHTALVLLFQFQHVNQ